MKKTDRSEIKDIAMSADQFRAWRKSLGFKQKDAADALGLKKRMIQYYEKGKRDDKRVIIPKTVRLACHALSHGIADFDGENVVTDTSGALIPDSAGGASDKDHTPSSMAGNGQNPLPTGDV